MNSIFFFFTERQRPAFRIAEISQETRITVTGSPNNKLLFTELDLQKKAKEPANEFITNNDEIIACSAGATFVLLLTANGTMFSFGATKYGELGQGKNFSESKPKLISVPARIVKIATGSWHGVGIDTNGRAWIWGSGGFGRLGNGSFGNAYEPSLVTIPELKEYRVVKAAGGDWHTLLLLDDGTVYHAGANISTGVPVVPGQADHHLLFEKCAIINDDPVVDIACGAKCSLLVTKSGKLVLLDKKGSTWIELPPELNQARFQNIFAANIVIRAMFHICYVVLTTVDNKVVTIKLNSQLSKLIDGPISVSTVSQKNLITNVAISGSRIMYCFEDGSFWFKSVDISQNPVDNQGKVEYEEVIYQHLEKNNGGNRLAVVCATGAINIGGNADGHCILVCTGCPISSKKSVLRDELLRSLKEAQLVDIKFICKE